MSDDVQCENCGKSGRRKRGTVAPEDWVYIEAKDASDDGSIFIVWACSRECSEEIWQSGPGALELESDEVESEEVESEEVESEEGDRPKWNLPRAIAHAGLTLESPCSACNGGPDPRQPDVICAWCGGVGARLIRPARHAVDLFGPTP